MAMLAIIIQVRRRARAQASATFAHDRRRVEKEAPYFYYDMNAI